jgi:uncharacterized membrane protein
MSDKHSLATEIARLNALEQRVIDQFIHRKRQSLPKGESSLSFGERVADQVAAFGGSWTFIGIALAIIVVWMGINVGMRKPFDPYPYILLNLALSCVAALQAPVIMMSQNRQADRDRSAAQHDYEVNTKAELEIVGLHAKLDEIRDVKWLELLKVQEEQIALLSQLVERSTDARK